jgi:hypothetical protein
MGVLKNGKLEEMAESCSSALVHSLGELMLAPANTAVTTACVFLLVLAS